MSKDNRGMMGYRTPQIDRIAAEGAIFTDAHGQQSCTAGRAAFVTGQFGKNHLGDRNQFFPTVHGFDEFLGNLYNLNAEEEPENPDYPRTPAFKAKFGPRGVFHCWATDKASTLPTDPRFGAWGKQRCEDTGSLTAKRMEAIDGARLSMLVPHDDAKREHAFGPAQGLPDTKVGAFPQELCDQAKKQGWVVIRMKDDWKKIFAFEPSY